MISPTQPLLLRVRFVSIASVRVSLDRDLSGGEVKSESFRRGDLYIACCLCKEEGMGLDGVGREAITASAFALTSAIFKR